MGLAVKPVGEPDAGDRHVRFDERGWETERWPLAPSYRAHPRLYLNSKSLRELRLSVAGGISAVAVAQGKMTRLPLEYPLTVVSRSIDGYGRNFLHRMEEQGRWRTLH